ncbi:4546_t:CDS:2 [Cetraspora pellucida]|uniref:4546_t:CDS:1 n=1 Tax=Cetraspora pellucida TaxID=1433469 RepID=A0A9N9I9X8_9GLOM|nr:4546_t:CDS:2 [Cetraspora pellucida]
MDGHNHLPDATHSKVIKAVTEIKKHASESREKPIQLIQNFMANISEDVQPFMPSLDALRQIIFHSKPIEKIPQSHNVLEINILSSLHVTLNGDFFLIKDLIVDQSRILIFSTDKNIRRLSKAPYWIMDVKDDSIECIHETLKAYDTISKMVGGIGLKIHNIRASGFYISEANAEASELMDM